MKIATISGHSVISKGAVGNAGMSEFDFNEEVLVEMARRKMYPSEHEFGHFYRDADIVGYEKQMKNLHIQIDAWGADVSIEFHFNDYHDKTVNGNEVLYCSNGGKRIAEIFDEELDTLPNRDRGIKKVTALDHGGGFCCKGKSYAIIVEPFFATNQDDFMHDGKNRMLLLEAYSNALKRI